MTLHTTSTTRRANTLILVIGILILLVLIGIMFIVKSQSIRITASAQSDAARINEQARSVGQSIADEVAIQLFPSELVSGFGDTSPSSGNSRRKAPLPDAIRYGHDRENPFNFAPYEVVPWTNPPDRDEFIDGPFAQGPANPLGGPSIGDSRWLRDTEPQRADLYDGWYEDGPSEIIPDGTPETFTHWRHLSNISRSDNAWRVVPDISDVSTSDLVSNLDLPIEQWPLLRPQHSNGSEVVLSLGLQGYPALMNGGFDQFDKMQYWTNPEDWEAWALLQQNPQALPQNFLDLSDLDGDGIHNEIGERYQDAFIKDTDRWHVERSLTDTDGDGFTDAFWLLSPLPSSSDTRQIVAISITDNSALLNLNVASQFKPSGEFIETRGHTPADLALVGAGLSFKNRVGFFDGFSNLPGNPNVEPWVVYEHTLDNPVVDWETGNWSGEESTFLGELGLNYDDVTDQSGRLSYWQDAGRSPFDAVNGTRPYTLTDEVELRLYEGNNMSSVSSRLEVALNSASSGALEDQFFRSSSTDANEATELRDQLENTELVFDNRRKVTLFNSVRNDLLPPWLRWEERFWNRYDPDGLGLPIGYESLFLENYLDIEGLSDGERIGVFGSTYPSKVVLEALAVAASGQVAINQVLENWREQSRTKVDLREYYADYASGQQWWESYADGKLSLAERLPLQLLLAMTNSQESGTGDLAGNDSIIDARGPLGVTRIPDTGSVIDWSNLDPYNQTRLMAAGLASNILTYRDEDYSWRQHSSLPLAFFDDDQRPRSELALSQMVSPPIIGRQDNVVPSDFPYKDSPVEGPNSPGTADEYTSVQMLGLEAQPFILEAFIGHVHKAKRNAKKGACCVYGRCFEVSEDSCIALYGGHFAGNDISCDGDDGIPDSGDEPCDPLGACCLETGGCVNLDESDCQALDGVWRGLIPCEESTCIGACCLDGVDSNNSSEGNCEVMSSFSCLELGAKFGGFDTVCASTSCAIIGSCCFDSGSCLEVSTESSCISLGGIFTFGVFCAEDQCPVGACCLNVDYGECIDVTENTCVTKLGGVYLGREFSCAEDPCNPIGSCCFGSGSCVNVMSNETCLIDGGTYVLGEFCVDGAATTEIIQFPDGDTWLQESSPTIAHGRDTTLWAGEQGNSNRMHILLNYQLDEALINGRAIQGATLLLQYRNDSGTPSLVTLARVTEPWLSEQATWNTSNGLTAWSGGGGAVGSVDTVNPLSLAFKVGADTGNIELDVTDFVNDAIKNRNGLVSLAIFKAQADGFDSRTEFFSSESSNPPALTLEISQGVNPCVGSCCLETGLCKELSQDTCIEYGGYYLAGFSCTSFSCHSACCLVESCEETSAETCIELEGTYLGDGSSCSDDVCKVGFCCLDSGTCLDVYSQEACYALGGNSFVEGEDCTSTACLFLGACCFNSGGCSVVSADSCDNFGGIYRGIGTDCGEGCGPIGSCCLSDGIRAWVNELHYDDMPRVWLNELHYVDAEQDFEELIEIAAEATVDPSAVTVYLYNGTTGLVYDSLNLETDFTVGQLAGGMLFYSAVHLFEGDFELRDARGSPDGLAIVYDDGVEHVLHFLSYIQRIDEDEDDSFKVFTAADGPALGMVSKVIGESEDPRTEEIGTSIGLNGSAAFYEDFGWVKFAANSALPPSVNVAQMVLEPDGGSVHELIEIALDESIDPEDVRIVLYDGDANSGDSDVYNEFQLSTFASDGTDADASLGGMILYSRIFTGDVLQDGGANGDGIAIVFTNEDGEEEVMQFVSYEGDLDGDNVGFTATSGPAAGMPSLLIPLSENETSKVGSSIGVTGKKIFYNMGDWTQFPVNSAYPLPLLNDGQVIGFADGTYGGCLVTTEIGCLALPGTYNGDETTCTPPNLCGTYVRGACCLDTGFCEDNVTEDSCRENLHGVWKGENQQCFEVDCANEACCLPSGTCMEIPEVLCNDIDGASFSGGACESTSCILLGSCCMEFGFCIDEVSESTCDDLAGDFIFSSCVSEDCFESGACCFESGTCIDVRNQFACENIDGQYKGDGVFCVDGPCSGSCCLPGGACIDTKTAEDCEVLAGEFLESAVCNSRPCVGACCITRELCDTISKSTCELTMDGTFIGFGTACDVDDPCLLGEFGACCVSGDTNFCIEDTNEAACETLSGTHFPGRECEEVLLICNITSNPFGACCLGEDKCSMVSSEEECIDIGGDYAGDETSCAANACIGSCCLKSGSCIETNLKDCEEGKGGAFQGISTSCEDIPCSGACCLDSGSCVDVQMYATCSYLGGEFMGFGSSCSNDPCGGACCLDQLGCEYVSGPTCVDFLGGSFLGKGVSCVTDPCVEGSCCLESGSCLDSRQSSCIFYGGVFFENASCEDDPCLGACCLWTGGCEMLSIETCEGLWDPDEDTLWSPDDPPGYFNGFGEDCDDPDGNTCAPQGSCCMPSGSCVDIRVIAIDEELSTFFYFCETVLGGSFSGVDLCQDRSCVGGCCLFEGGCEDLPETSCFEFGGDFIGVGIGCETNPCIEGACCFDSGSCHFITENNCVENQGEFRGEGVLCEDIECIEYFLVTNYIEEHADTILRGPNSPQETISVVQIANPFDREIDLTSYSMEFFGQEVKFSALTGLAGSNWDGKMAPSTYNNPSTIILYAMPDSAVTGEDLPNPSTIMHTASDPTESRDFSADWLDFLDIHPVLDSSLHPENTYIIKVPLASTLVGSEEDFDQQWSTSRAYYDERIDGEQNSVALYSFDEGIEGEDDTQRVLIDRLDRPNYNGDYLNSFDMRVGSEMETQWEMLLMDDHPVGDVDELRSGYITLKDANGSRIPVLFENDSGEDEPSAALFVQWDRATRAWGVDTPNPGADEPQDTWHNDVIDSWEKNPRYTFAARDFIRSQQSMQVTNADMSPKFQDIQSVSGFNWSRFKEVDDYDGDENPDGEDPDLLPDNPDPWFWVEVWSPRAGVHRVGSKVDGEVKGGLRTRKPTYFAMNVAEDPAENWSYPDKGWYGQHVDLDGDRSTSDTSAFEDSDDNGEIISDEVDMTLNFPLQMLQKDADFEQVGELLNVWLFGHMVEGWHNAVEPGSFLRTMSSPLDIDPGSFENTYVDSGTITTFSEFMYPELNDWWAGWVGSIENNAVVLDERVNRLRFQPKFENQPSLMLDGRSGITPETGAIVALNHPWPRLSIAARVLDSFVCDGPGHPEDLDTFESARAFSFFNANGFTGKGTPGIININTATPEVLRTLPNMYKMVYPGNSDDDISPRTMIPESIIQWREQASGGELSLENSGFTAGPDFTDRTITTYVDFGLGPKHTRGFSSPAEIGMLTTSGSEDWSGTVEPWNIDGSHEAYMYEDAWRLDFAARNPYGFSAEEGIVSPLSSEFISYETDNQNPDFGEVVWDDVSNDAEEINMLQAGISNLISTTSDMFTIHFRIRTFKRNLIDGFVGRD